MSIYPWNQLSEIGSPFVQTFSKIGITFAAGLINFVVITAALSGCNSGIFSASRMVYTLAINGKMSKKFLKLSRHGAPFYPVVAISGGILIGLILNYLLPMFINQSENIFVFVYSSSILPGMVPWVVILISEIRFKKTHADKMHDHPFKMPLSPYTNYATLAFLAIVLIFMFINPETRISLIIGLVFLLYMTIHYFIREKEPPNKKNEASIKGVFVLFIAFINSILVSHRESGNSHPYSSHSVTKSFLLVRQFAQLFDLDLLLLKQQLSQPVTSYC